MLRPTPLTLVPVALTLVLLASCSSGPEEIAVGQSAEYEKDDVTFSVSIDSVEKGDIADMSNFNLDADDTEKTPFYVSFTVDPEGSEASADAAEHLTPSVRAWTAKTTDGAATPIDLIDMSGDFRCDMASDDFAEALEAGEAASGCQTFLMSDEGEFESIRWGDIGVWTTS